MSLLEDLDAFASASQPNYPQMDHLQLKTHSRQFWHFFFDAAFKVFESSSDLSLVDPAALYNPFSVGSLIGLSSYTNSIFVQWDGFRASFYGFLGFWIASILTQRTWSSLFLTTVLLGLTMVFFKANLKHLRIKFKKELNTISKLAEKTRPEAESAGWINSFLECFWHQYENDLSAMIQKTVNDIVVPFKTKELDELALSKFTLGSSPIRVNYIKLHSSPKPDVMIMDMAVEMPTYDMETEPLMAGTIKKPSHITLTARLASGLLETVQIPPYIKNLLVRSKIWSRLEWLLRQDINVHVKDIKFSGVMRIEITFYSVFPHLKLINASFYHPPSLDFSINPITESFDLMDIPVLRSQILAIVEDNLKAILVAPNKYPVDLSVATIETAPVGVLKVEIRRARGLRNSEALKKSDPYASVYLGGNKQVAQTVSVKDSLEPKWNEVHYVVIDRETLTNIANGSDQIVFKVKDADTTVGKDAVMGVSDPLSLSQWIRLLDVNSDPVAADESAPGTDGAENGTDASESSAPAVDEELEKLRSQWGDPSEPNFVWKQLHRVNKKETAPTRERGGNSEIQLGLSYFKALPNEATIDPDALLGSTKSGILQVHVHKLDGFHELKNSYSVAIKTDKGRSLFQTKFVHGTHPVIEESYTMYVPDHTKLHNRIEVYSKNGRKPIAYLPLDEDLLRSGLNKTHEFYALSGSEAGNVALTLRFFAVPVRESALQKSRVPIAALSFDIKKANDLKSVDGPFQKSDPYVIVEMANVEIGRTTVREKTLNPIWNESFKTVVFHPSAKLTMVICDWNKSGVVKPLGRIDLPLTKLFEIETESGATGTRAEDPYYTRALADGLTIAKNDQNGVTVTAPIYLTGKKKSELQGTIEFDAKLQNILGDCTIGYSSIVVVPRAIQSQGSNESLKEPAAAAAAVAGGAADKSQSLRLSPSDANITLGHQSLDRGSKISTESLNPGQLATIKSQQSILSSQGGTLLTEGMRDDILNSFPSGVLHIQVNESPDVSQENTYVRVSRNQDVILTTSTQSDAPAIWDEESYWVTSDIHSASIKFQLFQQRGEDADPSSDPLVGAWEGPVSSFIGIGQHVIQLERSITLGAGSPGEAVLKDHRSLSVTLRYSPLQLSSNGSSTQPAAPIAACTILIESARDLKKVDGLFGKSDPYAKVMIEHREMGTTTVREKTLDPVWNESFNGILMNQQERLMLVLKDWNKDGKEKPLGRVDIPFREMFRIQDSVETSTDEYVNRAVRDGFKIFRIDQFKAHVIAPVYLQNGQKFEHEGVIEFKIFLHPIKEEPLIGYSQSILSLVEAPTVASVLSSHPSGVLNVHFYQGINVTATGTYIEVIHNGKFVSRTTHHSERDPLWDEQINVLATNMLDDRVEFVLKAKKEGSSTDPVIGKWNGDIKTIIGKLQVIDFSSQPRSSVRILISYAPAFLEGVNSNMTWQNIIAASERRSNDMAAESLSSHSRYSSAPARLPGAARPSISGISSIREEDVASLASEYTQPPAEPVKPVAAAESIKSATESIKPVAVEPAAVPAKLVATAAQPAADEAREVEREPPVSQMPIAETPAPSSQEVPKLPEPLVLPVQPPSVPERSDSSAPNLSQSMPDIAVSTSQGSKLIHQSIPVSNTGVSPPPTDSDEIGSIVSGVTSITLSRNVTAPTSALQDNPQNVPAPMRSVSRESMASNNDYHGSRRSSEASHTSEHRDKEKGAFRFGKFKKLMHSSSKEDRLGSHDGGSSGSSSPPQDSHEDLHSEAGDKKKKFTVKNLFKPRPKSSSGDLDAS